MQQQFFELAAKEAQKTRTRLLVDKKKLTQISGLLGFKEIEPDDSWRNWRICVVDGSDSPVMSERMGGRFGTYGVTYHIFEGLELVEEDYYGGEVVDLQIGDQEASKKVLSLMTVALERDVAVSCLSKNIDVLMIDGSFFGFRPRCRMIHNKKIPSEEYSNGMELMKSVRDSTLKLLRSDKTVGIIKRVQTAAIDGWTIYRNGNDDLVLGRNDKEILTSLLRDRRFFSYQDLFGEPEAFNYFARLALAYELYARGRQRSIESIFKACVNDVEQNIKQDLLCEPNQILQTARHYVRCSYPAPPFCLETPIGYDLKALLGLLVGSCNKATGLPLQLDLTDQDVTIPAGFTQEFVEEIEANLVKDPELDTYEIENHFASLNPQKHE
jgi:hypothetical protein